jgi:hypothetical protein
VLVPGGKEAEDYTQTTPEAPQAPTATPETPRTHFEDMPDTPVSSWSTGKWGARHDYTPLSGPPDKLVPRIDAFSFSCQECKRTILLSWQKVKASIGNNQLQVDCPHCNSQYPFEYERAQKKTLHITFRGIIRKEQHNNEPAGFPIPEPEAEIDNTGLLGPLAQPTTAPQDTEIPAIGSLQPVATAALTNPLASDQLEAVSENPVGEAAKAIRNSSRALVDSLVNNRLFQTVASRLTPSTTTIFSEEPRPAQFTHVLVPGGKEAESFTEVIPVVPNKWAPSSVTNQLDQSHGNFEDMPNRDKPASQPEPEPSPQPPIALIGPPDQLQVHVESFLFNCQDCDKPIGLSWGRVEAGPATPPFPVDCPSCQRQYPFDYEQAKRKTLTLRFSAPLAQAQPETLLAPSQEPQTIERPSPDQETPGILEPPKNPLMVLPKNAIIALRKHAIMAMPKNAIETLRKHAIVALPKKNGQDSGTADQTLVEGTQYSPGIAYDRAILERG